MASGIIIHVNIGKEKSTELFLEEHIRIGSSDSCDLQIRLPHHEAEGIWLELQREGDEYRVTDFNQSLGFLYNDGSLRKLTPIIDGDIIKSDSFDITFSFFALTPQTSLIKTNREPRQIAHFIEEAALEAASSPRRDEAKMFLKEFVRELSREVSWTTKLITLVLSIGFLSGILYLGYGFYSEVKQNKNLTEQQNEVINRRRKTGAK